MKRYYEIVGGSEATDRFDRPVTRSIKVYTRYSLGGMNYFFGTMDPRGYYLHVQIVEQADGMESMTLLDDSGFRVNILPVMRQSAKRALEAEELAAAEVDKYVRLLADRNGISITGQYQELS